MEKLLRSHLPYCLDRQPDGRYVLLNRDYKPLGFHKAGWIEYAEYPIAWTIKGLTVKKAAELDWAGRESLDRIYLYNDGSTPALGAKERAAYYARLEKLMALKAE